jgi:hypothetical protein
MELLAGLIGVVVGAGVTVGVAYLERRWGRQEVRAAERRTRWEERFEPVWRYATAMQEFVHQAGHLMERWEEQRPPEAWQSLAWELQGQLRMLSEEAEALRPRPGALYVLQDEEARQWYVALQLVVFTCRYRCERCLGVGEVMSLEDRVGFTYDADDKVKQLQARMQGFVEDV